MRVDFKEPLAPNDLSGGIFLPNALQGPGHILYYQYKQWMKEGIIDGSEPDGITCVIKFIEWKLKKAL